MSSESITYTVEELISEGVLAPPLDGNHGEIHPKASDFVASGIPFIMASDMKDGRVDTATCSFISEDQASKLRKGFSITGDVLLSHKATIGRTALVEKIDSEYIVLTPQVTYYRVLDPKRLNNRYLKYYFDSLPFQQTLASWAGAGSTRAYIGITAQRKLPITFPAIAVQETIAEMIGGLDDRITLLSETNTTLEAIAKALFKSWFVDFDPVRAKQEGREPEGMDADTSALFPDSFEESELGLVPKEWRVGTVTDLAKLNPESWTAKTHPETVRYIDLANTKNNEIDAIMEYLFDEAPSRARRVLRAGDSVIGTVRPGNRSFAFIYQAPSNLTGSTGFAVLRPIKAQNSEFIFIAATQDSSIDHLAHVADGGAYPAVRPEVVANIQSILPSEDVMSAFHNVVAPLFARAGENQTQAQILATIRDTLLPRLISGQLRLPDAEAFIEEATV